MPPSPFSTFRLTISPPPSTSTPAFPLLPLRGFSNVSSFSGRWNRRLPLRLKVVRQSLGDRWKISDIDTAAVQEKLSSWLLKAQTVLTEVTAPLMKPVQGRKPDLGGELETTRIEEIFMASELTVERQTPNGSLSLAAVISIEQFARMNGLTGRKMQKIFEALAPKSVSNDARNLVEYCCFRYLSRDSSDIHPCLKDVAFQRLIFITMVAWEQPYRADGDSDLSLENSSLQRRLVGEEAFVRIAPAIPSISDRSTAHHLFKALVGDERGISLSLWTTYIAELLKVHEGRKSYQTRGDVQISSEQLLCVGSSRKRPVLKWKDNIAWPGNLILTDKALYFEAFGLIGRNKTIRLDLSRHGSRVEKAKVGPFGSRLFDSAVSVSSGSNLETWVLEFVDFGGEMRRDVWHSFICEVISLYGFIREFGPEDGDPSTRHVYGAHKGNIKAITSAANSIARLQCLQFLKKLSEDPTKLMQFSYLQNVPHGDVVLQTLALNFWGGPLITKFMQADNQADELMRPPEEICSGGAHVFDMDGSLYLRKWMKSSSWGSSSSISFWKNASVRQGIVLSKNLVVADLSLVERAALTCKERSKIVEKTQATIDAAMIKGIPSNIDLFKELMFPFTAVSKSFEELRRWKEPYMTISFLVIAYTVIFRNLLLYVLPVALMILASTMLLLKSLKQQGRLGRSFGKVTIHDQPPSNTIQTIIAVKEAMSDLESFLQNLNVSLLKIRAIVLSSQPEVTNEVAFVLLCAATILLVVPFRYVLAFLLLDIFTQELEFRREMVVRVIRFLKERWAAVHAAPVVVLPYEGDEPGSLGDTASEIGRNENRNTPEQ